MHFDLYFNSYFILKLLNIFHITRVGRKIVNEILSRILTKVKLSFILFKRILQSSHPRSLFSKQMLRIAIS